MAYGRIITYNIPADPKNLHRCIKKEISGNIQDKQESKF